MNRHTIQVGSGAYIDLLNPDPAALRIDDLLIPLSRTPRFNGATKKVFTVAEHLVFCSDLLPGVTPQTRMAVLLHDMHEALIGDITTPVGGALDAIYRDDGSVTNALHRLKVTIDYAIRLAFGLPLAMSRADSNTVKMVDLLALATERRWFMPDCNRPWPGLPEPSDDVTPARFVDGGYSRLRFLLRRAVAEAGYAPLGSLGL